MSRYHLSATAFSFLGVLFSCGPAEIPTSLTGSLPLGSDPPEVPSQPNPDPPPGTSPPTSEPSGDYIVIQPGDNIQGIVERHPEGAAFLLKAGVHRRQTIRPKPGMTFIGELGTVLDGEMKIPYAFDGVTATPPVDHVTIRALEIRNYSTPLQMGAIRAGDHGEIAATGWVIEGCNIHNNAGGGIRTGHQMVIRNNLIHKNGQIGVVGKGDNVLVENNEIAYNNTRGIDSGWEAGGLKLLRAKNLVLRDNYVHHNNGPGLWMDGSSMDVLIEGNQVEDNESMGIFFEISYGAVIRDNYVEGNGFFGKWLYGSGILISASTDAEVYGNTVEDNGNGITAVMQDRGSGPRGRYEVRNLYVHDNVITMRYGVTGLAQDVGNNSYFTSKNNRFERNTYNLGSNTHHFAWMNEQLTKPEWHAYGHDNEEDSGAP